MKKQFLGIQEHIKTSLIFSLITNYHVNLTGDLLQEKLLLCRNWLEQENYYFFR